MNGSFAPIGLNDLSVFVPRNSLNLEVLRRIRVEEDPGLEKHLQRALATTGQRSMRFPSPTEDTVTLAAEALRLLLAPPKAPPLTGLRFLTLGTETSVDMSKSGSSYVLGLLQKSGHNLPFNLSSFQVQHACAGGTLALLTTAGFLQAAGREDDSSIVLTSDIARYKAPSTAEVTQGAGATGLWLARHPDLLVLDLPTTGFASHDVDDFFRPLGSTIAKVKGGYSLACYNEALSEAFEDHCSRAGVRPGDELESIDLFCLHVPYALMPISAMDKLLAKHLGLDAASSRSFLENRGFFKALEATAEIGNLYTGSLWLNLAFSLEERLQTLGSAMAGKRVLMASYGSGNTMAVFTGTIAAGAPEVIGRWNLEGLLRDKNEPPFQAYQYWLDTHRTFENYPAILERFPPEVGRFALTGLREDGYREYSLI
jgi:hydroxymethylglutaryl-CoA synthase